MPGPAGPPEGASLGVQGDLGEAFRRPCPVEYRLTHPVEDVNLTDQPIGEATQVGLRGSCVDASAARRAARGGRAALGLEELTDGTLWAGKTLVV